MLLAVKGSLSWGQATRGTTLHASWTTTNTSLKACKGSFPSYPNEPSPSLLVCPSLCRSIDETEDLLSRDILLATIVSQLQPLGAGTSNNSELTPVKRARSQQLDVHMDTWQIPFCQIKLIKQIGKGSFGRVSHCRGH